MILRRFKQSLIDFKRKFVKVLNSSFNWFYSKIRDATLKFLALFISNFTSMMRYGDIEILSSLLFPVHKLDQER